VIVNSTSFFLVDIIKTTLFGISFLLITRVTTNIDIKKDKEIQGHKLNIGFPLF